MTKQSSSEELKILVIGVEPTEMTQHFLLTGYHVITAMNGLEALRQVYDKHPDIVLLDPDSLDSTLNGYAFCGRLREFSYTPIIVVSEREEPAEIVRYLELGADDYLVKPIKDDQVLYARLRAKVRRAREQAQQVPDRHYSYDDGFLKIDLDDHRLLRDNIPVKLTPTEFDLLSVLIKKSPHLVSYEQLLREIWGEDHMVNVDYLRVYVWHLRRKIERDSKRPAYLVNEMGAGYRFRAAVTN